MSQRTRYTMDDVRSTLRKLAAGLAEVGKTQADRAHAAEVKTAARSIAAQAVAQSILANMGEPSFRGLCTEELPSKRHGVSISEARAVLLGITVGKGEVRRIKTPAHTLAAKILPLWAAGNFAKYSVGKVLAEVRGKKSKDFSAMLSAAIAGLLAGGKFIPADIRKAVEATLTDYIANLPEDEQEVTAEVRTEGAHQAISEPEPVAV